VHPDDVTARAVDVMLATGQGRLPVKDRNTGVLVGLLTRKDLLRVRGALARAEDDRHACFAQSWRVIAGAKLGA